MKKISESEAFCEVREGMEEVLDLLINNNYNKACYILGKVHSLCQSYEIQCKQKDTTRLMKEKEQMKNESDYCK